MGGAWPSRRLLVREIARVAGRQAISALLSTTGGSQNGITPHFALATLLQPFVDAMIQSRVLQNMLGRHSGRPQGVNGFASGVMLGACALFFRWLIEFWRAQSCHWLVARRELRNVRAGKLDLRQLPRPVMMARIVANKPRLEWSRVLPVDIVRLEIGRNVQLVA